MNKALKPFLTLLFIFILGGVVIYADQTGMIGSTGTTKNNNGGGGNSDGYGTIGQ